MSPFFRKLSIFVQKYRAYFLVVSCGGVFVINVSYHIFPVKTYKALYQAYFKGQPAALSEKLQETFQSVLKDVDVKSPEKYSAFAAFGFHPVSAGIPWMPSGVLVGIPANFNCTTESSKGLTDHTVMMNGKELQWNSDTGKVLKDALTFSCKAQKFAVAREVLYLKDNSPVLHALVAPVCLASTCLSGLAFQQMLSIHSGPIVFRGLYNLAVAVVGICSYFLVCDTVGHWLDYRADRKAAVISKDYAKGGIEFYDKILLRNRIFRNLMGKNGEEMYSACGNLFPKHWFRLKHAPYTSRKEIILKMMKDQ
ncbi:transmembrane protein 177 isoform X2 [Protopterus annectens]|nr:transmembrane protein 177 isoform X2 [Protopterus annectens]XP_043916589.1 transmembrane protein 177 isoform X2 [Protopterus annectens]XP_043916590.1 transmembrane protein 177 isoform X2 [Protopterus annectens]XP_043916591.1 transmembrane protein 177 isoform X2 [Protopterus annectens]XP_043916592.1 transmembrane protein 177 isoform X2 [Protopterus annectens]XP_043916593.1 transmembrane protein 177 isoform X2 [Protopterus annectens]XP_043916594.1 transmembrane protein 177 isoform X2 [Protop